MKASSVQLWLSILFLAFAPPPGVHAQEAVRAQVFRYISPELRPPDPWPQGKLRLVADADFPPFSYVSANGEIAGISIDIANAVCAELKLPCEIAGVPQGELVSRLESGGADAVISPLRLSADVAEKVDVTRPIYRPAARFAVRPQTRIKAATPQALAERKLGVVDGTAHAAWAERYYGGAELLRFATEGEALEALRTGQVEVLFGDGLRLIYWIDGKASRGCCVLMPGSYFDSESFSPGYAFVTGRDRPDLRAALDYGLDKAQQSGAIAAAFRRYVPLPAW